MCVLSQYGCQQSLTVITTPSSTIGAGEMGVKQQRDKGGGVRRKDMLVQERKKL